MALKIISSVIALISAFALITSVSSFSTPTFANNVVRYRSRSYRSKSSLEMGFGDAFKSAFSNDASLGKVQNAGLKNGPNNNDNVTMNGKPVKAVVGQKVSIVANAARVKISYNCQQGDCGTCMVKMNGRKVKACQMKIPSGKCSIETL